VVTFVLDASAILRYLDEEEGADRMTEVLKGCFEGRNRAEISSVQWGEVACRIFKSHGEQMMLTALSGLLRTGVQVISATQQRAVRSGIIKGTKKIPYADCFAVELASDSADHVLMTADFDLKPAAKDIRIEFLPAKLKPN
jgi:predicted nucleic acid-binding protein